MSFFWSLHEGLIDRKIIKIIYLDNLKTELLQFIKGLIEARFVGKPGMTEFTETDAGGYHAVEQRFHRKGAEKVREKQASLTAGSGANDYSHIFLLGGSERGNFLRGEAGALGDAGPIIRTAEMLPVYVWTMLYPLLNRL